MSEAMEDRVKMLEDAIDVLGEVMKENPVSPKCHALLTEKISPEICYDFRKVRAIVMCDTWRRMEEERIPFGEAIKRSWAEIKSRCAEEAKAYI